jgi:hypothetical protein
MQPQIIASIISFASACLVAGLTYRFAIQSKKVDILYQHKVPAFKAVVAALIDYKEYCLGRITDITSDTTSPYYDNQLGAVHYHGKFASEYAINSVFFSKNDRVLIEELLSKMAGISNAEISFGRDQMMVAWLQNTIIEIDNLIQVLYKDLKLQ